MKRLLRSSLFTLLIGIFIGLALAEYQKARESQAFASDPRVKDLLDEHRRLRAVDRWIDDLTESEL